MLIPKTAMMLGNRNIDAKTSKTGKLSMAEKVRKAMPAIAVSVDREMYQYIF